MKAKILSILFTVVICFVASFIATACVKNKSKTATIEITDMVGDKVSVPKNAKKVAVLARSAVDMLVAFGLGDKIDGVYYTVLDNEWAKFLYPQSKDYFAYSYDTTIETYLARGVDLVIAPEQYLAENLREHGITAFTISQYGIPNYDNYVFAFAEIVKSIWDNNTTKNLVNDWENEFANVRDEITTKLADVKTTKTIFYVRGDKNKGVTYTENTLSLQDTFAKYLKLDCAGKYFSSNQPTAEAFLSFDPDYIIVGGIYQHTLTNTLKTSEIWRNLSAVKNNNIFNIGVGYVMFEQTGVENTIYLADMANKIYPDKFNFNVKSMLKAQTLKFFGTEISDADAENMLAGLNRNGQPLSQEQ